MENLKNIIMSSEFISLFITNGLILAIFYKVLERYKFREKFYQTVLEGHYSDLLYFLLLGVNKPNWEKKILGTYYFNYERYLKRGFYKYFDSRLNVRVTSSRIGRIQEFLGQLRNYIETKAPNTTEEKKRKYFAVVKTELKSLIVDLPPSYFAGCYVSSIREENNSESEARGFLLDLYSECSGSDNEKISEKANEFVKWVNDEIEKSMQYNISKEKKDILHIARLSITKKSETKEYSFVHPQMY